MPKRKITKCSIWFCRRTDIAAHGLCRRHYNNRIKTGAPVSDASLDACILLDIASPLREAFLQIFMWVEKEYESKHAPCPICKSKYEDGALQHTIGCPIYVALETLEPYRDW